MVEPEHWSWKSEMACSMAFFWAEEPSPLSVPLPQATLDDEPEDVPPAAGLALLSEPQAVSASVPTRATPVSWPRRWIFTVVVPSVCRVRGDGSLTRHA